MGQVFAVVCAVVMSPLHKMRFRDRSEAGRLLASQLTAYVDRPDVVVLALPRGGVPVGYEVASSLHVPLDVFVVRKLGVPGREEFAMGAVASGGIRVLDADIANALGISELDIEAVTERELRELRRREEIYRGSRPSRNVQGQTVILVDDGLATGSSMRAAVAALERQQPGRIVIAVPVAAPSVCAEFQQVVDQILCAVTPQEFYAVSLWYESFPQVSDEEVRQLLELAEQDYAAHMAGHAAHRET